MGKIRVKTIGAEDGADKEQKKIKERNDAKKAEAAKRAAEKANAETTPKETKSEEKDQRESTSKSADISEEAKPVKKAVSKYKAKISKKKNPHSANYLAIAKLIDKDKKYTIEAAIGILVSAKGRSSSGRKFDETVELHINTHEKGVAGSLTLPHGTGKKAKIEIADYAGDPKHVEDLVKAVSGGVVDFDILIATPDTMSHLAKIARVLGPRGLMPNPKNGTINPKPQVASKKFELGQINFKTEPKFPIIHMTVGKLSFVEKQLSENITAILAEIKASNIKSVTLKSTMSPGIKIIV